ncbi:Queuosine salvage protein [Psilocybe cubensis]|uniref:Queuosine salvage protein n=1 Tax=Psilocybe cubensis TaxID=181762 RepID=A0ACB8H054_PSICU|nr:Queuosine salvage protein [Psilocybe cubensis]KAH9480634.1 Queuosine salvage protein [Psilocybe cubensis]
MTIPLNTPDLLSLASVSEKSEQWAAQDSIDVRNPVVESSEFAYRATDLVHINDDGVKNAAKYIRQKLLVEKYTPRTWRTHALHICPSEPYNPEDPLNKSVLDWIFLISSLNFSFWSEKEGRPDRYGVEWRAGWDSVETKIWTGYWSLVAALNRALEEDIPITDPHFYSSETLCPDSLIEHVFRKAPQSTESIPLLKERIAVMRECAPGIARVLIILRKGYGGSFKGFLDDFQRQHDGQGTSLDLATMVANTFPSFRDEVYYEGTKVCLWKRAQILVAETWAAFYPPSPAEPHPLFPGSQGPQISRLTMFADYRVPQILHHLCILTYPASLLRKLHAHTPLAPGSREEISLRASSIIAVERVREEILRLIKHEEGGDSDTVSRAGVVSSVVIDFYLWDLAKKVESGEQKIENIDTAEMVPIHRTRSIWY